MCDFNKVKEFVDAAFHKDTYGTAPYTKHLTDCIRLLDSIGVKDNDLRCAMYAHDLAEDHIDQYVRFRALTNRRIYLLVAKLTRVTPQSYEDYITKMLAENNKEVLLLKLTDVCCNKEACILEDKHPLLKKYITTEAKLKLHFYYKYGIKYNNDTKTMLRDIVNLMV